MGLGSLLKQKTLLSLEVFPPKRTAPIETVYQMLAELTELSPDFISVTYGAGGNKQGNTTLEIASAIQQKYQVESVAHLPGMYLSKQEVRDLLAELTANGIHNILALRGDRIEGEIPCGDFKYASDLVSFIKECGDFHVIGAGYPEGHQESKTIVDDIHYLKQKVDAGTDHLITQLFFDNQHFYRFRERMDLAGIHVPVEAGIMPVINEKQIKRMVSLCGATLPPKFLAMMDKYSDNPLAMRDAGIAYAVDQIVDLAAQGVDGIHLYTMNNPYIAKTIYQAVANLL